MALTADRVSYSYGLGTSFASPALRDVSLTIERGGLVLVVGATGSGKSTLLRLLAGLLSPSAGTVDVDGAAPGDKAVRGRIGLVFQNPESQFFAETVLDDIRFGPKNLGHPDPERSAVGALRSVGLDPETFGPRSPFTLSGGEARRVAVAGVLALGPDYLLLDEPTAGLDAHGRDAVLAALAAVRTTTGVLVVTHDPEQFLAHADRVVALASGAGAFSGTPAELLADPAPYLRAGLTLPEIVEVQVLARERGAALDHIEFDPVVAARALAEARGRTP
ncbi:MAG: ATP-binding cassette domain-containing protein [Coriobacteriia bacterium]